MTSRGPGGVRYQKLRGRAILAKASSDDLFQWGCCNNRRAGCRFVALRSIQGTPCCASALCRCPESSRLAGSHCEISRFAAAASAHLLAESLRSEGEAEGIFLRAMRGLPVGIS